MRFDPRQKVNIIATTGALGDTCATFPTLKLLADRGHIEKLFVADRYMPLYQLFFPENILVSMSVASRFIPEEELTPDIPKSVIDPITGGATLFNYPVDSSLPLHKTLRGWPSTVHMHLIDAFSIAICDAILKGVQRNYPLVDLSRLPDNPFSGRRYAAIAYGATTEHRRMLPEVLAGLVGYLHKLGLEVVLLGNKDHALVCSGTVTETTFDAIPDGCVDMIGKTTIPEALAILSGADVVLGVDNGLIHLAALTDVPIVAGYTTVDPYYRTPQRHGYEGWRFKTVEPDSECRYCQTETFCAYQINFLNCHTATKECMKSLTLDKWVNQLEQFHLGS